MKNQNISDPARRDFIKQFTTTGLAGAIPMIGSDAEAQTLLRSFTTRDRMVMSYFFSWYNWPNPVNNIQEHIANPNGTDALSVHPKPQTVSFDRNSDYRLRKAPNLGGQPIISYMNTNWFISQLSAMNDCGIDVAAVDFWGFPWADVPPRSRLSLEVMSSAMDQMDSVGKKYPSVAMFMETVPLGNGGRPTDLSTEEGAQWFFSLIKDFYVRVRRERVAVMDGRVPVILYAAGIDGLVVHSYGLNRARELFRNWYGRDLAFFANSSWQSKAATQIKYSCHWGAAVHSSRLIDTTDLAEISPGYNYRGSTKNTPPDPTAYEKAWIALRRSGKNWVAIETWNEWHESTGIAETIENGTKFINITKTQARLFKSRQ